MSPVGQMLNQLNYSNKSRTKDDAKKVLDTYKSLIPRITDYVNNSGVQMKLLALNGTVPIKFQGVGYNIPVEIFIPERYPLEAPKVFVRPTSNMTIKSNHRHVDMQGVVYLPYLHEWSPNNASTSNLVGLVETCSSVFSIDPPLFSKQSASPPPTAASSSAVKASVAAVAQPSPVYAASAYGFKNNSAYSAVSSTSTPAVAVVTSLAQKQQLNDLQEKVGLAMQSKLYALHSKFNAELTAELENERMLDLSSQQAGQYVVDVELAMDQMKAAITEIESKTAALIAWQATERANREQSVDIEQSTLQPFDPVSAQIVKLHSESNAIDDALYFLERALVAAKIDLTSFLREVRSLSRQQFMNKAHLAKIQNTLQSPQQNMQQQQLQHTAPLVAPASGMPMNLADLPVAPSNYPTVNTPNPTGHSVLHASYA